MKSLGKSVAGFAAIGFIAKILGAFYRIPLTNVIGAEGMGLYQTVFPLYTLLLALCGGGMTAGVSRVTAKYVSRGEERTAVRAATSAAVVIFALSSVFTFIVILLRNKIAAMQGNIAAAPSYLALCPSLIFASVIGVLRGFFQGRSNMLPGGISQFIEQVVKLALGLTFSRLLLPRGAEYAVCGALIGVTVGEVAAFIYLAVLFALRNKSGSGGGRRKKRSGGISQPTAESHALYMETARDAAVATGVGAGVSTVGLPSPTTWALIKELFAFSLPITLGALVIPITQMIDSVLVINLLVSGGAARADATALYGLCVGPVGTLVNMPAVAVASVSAVYLPALTAAVENGKTDTVKALTRTAAKWIATIVVPITVAFALFPERAVGVLYSRGLSVSELKTATLLLRIESVNVFYVGATALCTTVLQAHDRSRLPVINLVIGAAAKALLTFFTVKSIGVVGVALGTCALYGISAALNARSAYRHATLGARITDFSVCLLYTVAATAVFAAFAIATRGLSFLPSSIISAAAFVAVYALVFVSGKSGRRRHGFKPLFVPNKSSKKML